MRPTVSSLIFQRSGQQFQRPAGIVLPPKGEGSMRVRSDGRPGRTTLSGLAAGGAVLLALTTALTGCRAENGAGGRPAAAPSTTASDGAPAHGGSEPATAPTVAGGEFGSASPAPSRSPARPGVPSGPGAGAGIGGPSWAAGALPPTQGGRYLYVSTSGSDRADGRSRATALRTLQRAADLTGPGDTVLVGGGEYRAPGRVNVLGVSRSGTAQRWITYAAYPGERPVVRATGWQGINVRASYITVAGFTVVGSRATLTAAQIAKAKRNDISDVEVTSNCIAVDEQRNANPPNRPHHVVVWGNTVTDCPLVGISAQYADYVTISYNEAARNGHWSPLGGSGISVFGGWNSDGNTGYKLIVRGNVTHDNWNQVPCRCSGFRKVTDGNGIIVDSHDNVDVAGAPLFQKPYAGRTLVENNISYNNGGRGINVFKSDHVDVVNNTLYHNARHPAIETDLGVAKAHDVRVANNIVVAGGSKPAVQVGGATDVRLTSNLLVGASKAPADPSALTGDPRFVAPDAADFRLRSGSPAIDSGTSALAPSADGRRAPRAGRVDRGALERG
ncbi:right-handed parallel beta-helix repeat-containing protein [Micromonospora vinacea]|uniref:right-handed parallel beta-helix repeat-containing protein n=1 Tax=Micromonospora vinacea TaxID=709878 RepID=UPI00344BD906